MPEHFSSKEIAEMKRIVPFFLQTEFFHYVQLFFISHFFIFHINLQIFLIYNLIISLLMLFCKSEKFAFERVQEAVECILYQLGDQESAECADVFDVTVYRTIIISRKMKERNLLNFAGNIKHIYISLGAVP